MDHNIYLEWKCDYCNKSFPDSEQPVQTYDGGTICYECFEEDDQGPQIARYGIDDYEDANLNEDPLEGAVEPVGGCPPLDRPLYDRGGFLIGHTPIEEPDWDDK